MSQLSLSTSQQRPPLPNPPGAHRVVSPYTNMQGPESSFNYPVHANSQDLRTSRPASAMPVRPPLPNEYIAEQQRLRSSQPTPNIVSPRPQAVPSFVPAARLESQASEVAATTPYRLGHYTSTTATEQFQNQASFDSTAPSHSNSFPMALSDLQLDDVQSGTSVRRSMPASERRIASLSAAATPLRQSVSADAGPRQPVASGSAIRTSLLAPQAAMPPRPTSTGPVLQHQTRSRESSLISGHQQRRSVDIIARLARPPVTEEDLASLREAAMSTLDPGRKVKWAKEIFRFLERNQSGSTIADPQMIAWVDEAIKIVLASAAAMPPVPEAVYYKADLAMAGTFPSIIPKNPKAAFRDFEAAANSEYAPAWYRIGREYETFNDLGRAREAYERGSGLGDVTSTYRLGMAHLLGQLTLEPNVATGLEYLHTSAIIAEQVSDTETAAPLYVWAMILAGEFEAPNIASASLPRNPADAGRYMQKAAYLCHATAQYKMGMACEHAQLGCAFDPFLSVQYYTLASQQGESEADMALSKWFLCGADGYFSANEDLAYSFADKAARKGLATAEFALGYYAELAIGTKKDLAAARRWYEKASAQNNEDAKNRLRMLEAGKESMSKAEHDAHAAALVRTRTQARIKSDAENRPATQVKQSTGQDLERKQTLRKAQQLAGSNAAAKRMSDSKGPAPLKRFTLSDTGSTNTSGPPRRPQLPEVVMESNIKKGPATFAEMGIREL